MADRTLSRTGHGTMESRSNILQITWLGLNRCLFIARVANWRHGGAVARAALELARHWPVHREWQTRSSFRRENGLTGKQKRDMAWRTEKQRCPGESRRRLRAPSGRHHGIQFNSGCASLISWAIFTKYYITETRIATPRSVHEGEEVMRRRRNAEGSVSEEPR